MGGRNRRKTGEKKREMDEAAEQGARKQRKVGEKNKENDEGVKENGK